jgi:hypothetical protein
MKRYHILSFSGLYSQMVVIRNMYRKMFKSCVQIVETIKGSRCYAEFKVANY